ncbi:MAG: CHASE2 domain-containing protein [Candidatus Obscuribacterales bacterium]|nr:CHASE2 domain-containing protein [Candidatus Obscuribacterales bacterium]
MSSSKGQKAEEGTAFRNLFLLFAVSSFLAAASLELSCILKRAELQCINRLFEARRYLRFSAEGLKRLNPAALLRYHEEHEIPRQWWAWDYTLSWLIEENHPEPKHKLIIFNHLLEDEPPLDALSENHWLKPLMQFPMARADLAQTVEFLARSGVKLIILDNDFPQYSPGDKVLAMAIHRSASGEFGGRKVPVLMAGTVNHRSYCRLLQLEQSSEARGILSELAKLEANSDPQAKYTGCTSLLLDEDQVVRQIACRLPTSNSQIKESMVIKVLQALGESLPNELPSIMDIDFAGEPNSELYPVRPISYLFDPEMRKRITSTNSNDPDVKLRGAIVIIGDGVTDVYATPYTNNGVNLMSGPEILAQALDTVARQSWPQRLELPQKLLYFSALSLFFAGLLCLWKKLIPEKKNSNPRAKLLLDIAFALSSLFLSFLISALFFAYAGLIVPTMVPLAALIIANLSTALLERENARSRAFKQELEHAEERLQLLAEKHKEEMLRLEAEAGIQAMANDVQRRKEFVKRINHDLKAPVTVMSWLLARLLQGGLSAESVAEKHEKLAKTANRLIDLLHELAVSYERGNIQGSAEIEDCQLNKILSDSFNMAKPLAEMKGDKLELSISDRIFWVNGNPLQLARIFDNLLKNAVVHNPPGTSIQIEARSRAHAHQVSIIDNGQGINPLRLEEIMQSDSLDSGDGSNGMGLKIARSFVEALGGKLTIKSEAGLGTTITITLPSSHLEPGGESGSKESSSDEEALKSRS